MLDLRWLWLLAAIVGWFGYASLFMRARRSFESAVNSTNRRTGSNFPLSPLLGDHSVGMVFDQPRREALHVAGRHAEVWSIDRFIAWQCDYQQRLNGRTTDVVLVIGTDDFARPELRFRVVSLRQGEEWLARLSALHASRR